MSNSDFNNNPCYSPSYNIRSSPFIMGVCLFVFYEFEKLANLEIKDTMEGYSDNAHARIYSYPRSFSGVLRHYKALPSLPML